MWAASERHPNVVRLLVEAGANAQAHTKKGFTALHFAAREGDIDSVRQLLASGVNVNIRSLPEAAPAAGQEANASASGGRSASGTAAAAVAPRGPAYQATISEGSTPLLVATVRGHVPLALFLLEQGADPNVLDAGFTPLHWASGTWEGGISNPVYGFTDPMGGIPNRQQKIALVKSLLAHGANPNARMTRRPPGFQGLGGGYEDAPGATPFLLASAADDLEMMRLLLAAGADPKLVTDTKATAVMAASGLNRGIGESPITEAQALDAVKFLFELGADARGATTTGENALFGAAYRGWNTLLRTADRQRRGRQRGQQSRYHTVACRFGIRRSSRRRALQHGGCGHSAETRRRSEAWQAVSGAGQMPVMQIAYRRAADVDDRARAVAWIGAVCVEVAARRRTRRAL